MLFDIRIVNLLADATLTTDTASPIAAVTLPLVLVLGFVVAVSIGSIAWYNSKRPPGWEGKERPEIVPKIDTSANPES